MIIASKHCACNKSWLKSISNTPQNPATLWRYHVLRSYHRQKLNDCKRLGTAIHRPATGTFPRESVYPLRVDAFFLSKEKSSQSLIARLAIDNPDTELGRAKSTWNLHNWREGYPRTRLRLGTSTQVHLLKQRLKLYLQKLG